MDSIICQGKTTALITEAKVSSSLMLLCDTILFRYNRIMKGVNEFNASLKIVEHQLTRYLVLP